MKFTLQYHLYFRLEEIGGAASKEYSLEKAMEKMKFEWKDICFEFIPYRDSVSITKPSLFEAKQRSWY